MKQETGSTRCGWWLYDRAEFHEEVHCGLPLGHEGDHVGCSTPVIACAEPLCALLTGHSEPHVDLGDREWQQGTDDVDALVAELTSVLVSPGLPQHAVRALNRVDELFGRMDILLRHGHALPTAWEKSRQDSTVPGCLDMDLVYDVTSETIRTTGGPPECWKALKTARSSWEMLH